MAYQEKAIEQYLSEYSLNAFFFAQLEGRKDAFHETCAIRIARGGNHLPDWSALLLRVIRRSIFRYRPVGLVIRGAQSYTSLPPILLANNPRDIYQRISALPFALHQDARPEWPYYIIEAGASITGMRHPRYIGTADLPVPSPFLLCIDDTPLFELSDDEKYPPFEAQIVIADPRYADQAKSQIIQRGGYYIDLSPFPSVTDRLDVISLKDTETAYPSEHQTNSHLFKSESFILHMPLAREFGLWVIGRAFNEILRLLEDNFILDKEIENLFKRAEGLERP